MPSNSRQFPALFRDLAPLYLLDDQLDATLVITPRSIRQPSRAPFGAGCVVVSGKILAEFPGRFLERPGGGWVRCVGADCAACGVSLSGDFCREHVPARLREIQRSAAAYS